MDKITIITPPDKLFNKVQSLLVITPSADLKIQLQGFMAEYPQSLNVYFYDESESDMDWLLSIINVVDCVIFDIDNSGTELRNFSSFIVSHDNVFYLTKDTVTPYNLISNNRIYDLNWIHGFFNGEN